MRILSLSLFLSLCLAAPASAQLGQILIVDGNQPPTLPYTHTRITDAAAAAGPNDTIRVKALTWMGFSGAYSQASTLENFPIILPAGVSITAYNSQPVYVSSGIGGVTLFQVQASTGTAPLTELEDLRLLGADQAIELLTGDGQSLNVRLENVLFGRNRIGLNATASGGSLTIAAVQCQIFDHGASVPIPAPAQQDFQVGLRFAAGRADTSGIVTATVSSLTTSGPFQGMDPDPIYSFGDLYGAGGMSKLVSVELINGVPEHPGHNSGDFFTRQQIPSVQLTVNGGIWDGKAAANDKGWDVGLFAATPISTGIGWKDYFTAFDVSLNGPELRGFRESGIYAMALTESRGVVRMSGGARVKGSGKHIATNPSDLRHSGVTLLSREAYLAFIAEDATIQSNLGNGILAYTPECLAVPVSYPQGLFLGLDGCDIHLNGLNGIRMLSSTDHGDLLSAHGGVVGGTWDDFPVSLSSPVRILHMDSGGIPSKPMPELKQGEGYINRTTISNNGVGTISTSRNGIRAEVYGNGYEDENGADTRFAAVSASVVNSFIWNNPGGGFSAELESMYSSALPGPLMLTPLVHTTVVGNGDQVGYNLEVAELGGPGTGTYFYDDLNYDLTFRIYDSLLQRKSSSSSDFGSYVLTNLLVSDFGTGVGTKDIGVAGIRAWINGGNTFPVSTDLAIPFVGSPLVWTDLIADQFFLQPSPGAAFEDACPDYLDVEAVWDEAGHDFQGDLRPSVFQNRDKGAEEL